MKINIYNNKQEIGNAVASVIAGKVLTKTNCILGLATGSTPIPTYNSLIELYKNGVVDFSGVRTFNLDEYYGIGSMHEQSYYKFMYDNLFSKINIDLKNTKIPSSQPKNLEQECIDYDESIEKAGGIDLQILGIGHNGHIAFNEPSDVFTYGTHIVDLTEDTIQANKRFFNSIDEVPKKAITMGIGTILKAREIIIIATGKDKANAIKAMLSKNIDPKCPASILNAHTNVTVFLDKEAASLI